MNSKLITKACNILKSGGNIGLPTETVYGLAGSINSQSGIKSIFKIKKRPFFDPLIVHISKIEQVKDLSPFWNKTCEVLAEKFWPGPLTMVLPKNKNISDLITSGLDSVGIRMPNHQLALELINQLGHPVAAPSANLFKKTSPTTKEHVEESFEDLLVLDGGPCSIGIESTVLGVFEDRIEIYRPGNITPTDIKNALTTHDVHIRVLIKESPVAPGQLKHHYMPNTPLIILKGNAKLTDFSEIPGTLLENTYKIDLEKDPSLFARMYYSKLRELDNKYSALLIQIPLEYYESENWQAILNRITKSATYTLPE